MNSGTLRNNISDFFPANRSDYEGKAGAVANLTEEDFDDIHKSRHLDSFKESMAKWKNYELTYKPTEKDVQFVRLLYQHREEIRSIKDLEYYTKLARRKLKHNTSKSHIGNILVKMREEGLVDTQRLERLALSKAVRTTSGVAVITVLTSPGKFSCPMDCHYCPNEPGQPRSYLSTEPAVLRGNQCNWDPAVQFWDRARTLSRNGHNVDKIEVLVLGGTWSGYSHEYQEEFCRDLFYAANTFCDVMRYLEDDAINNNRSVPAAVSVNDDLNDLMSGFTIIKSRARTRLSLEEEQVINESNSCKIIGLTLETRPDYINHEELVRFRYYGCTRVQIGVQHTDNSILMMNNRGHDIECTRVAISLLKANAFKVDIHLMPDLPGCNLELDYQMFRQILSDPSLQADQWKIYPCEVTPFTKISEWYKEGSYEPYAESPEGEFGLVRLILEVKYEVHPWIRLNRVIRDIPNQSIIAGNVRTNLRQILANIASKLNWKCPCIRCREVRLNLKPTDQRELVIRGYNSGPTGYEYFLSFESPSRDTIYAFCRLRIPNFSHCEEEIAFPALRNRCANIRELHVYGMMVTTHEVKSSTDERTQHSGLGHTLLNVAEVLAVSRGAKRMAIIAGVGTRNYYRRFGYALEDTYMTKDFSTPQDQALIYDKFFNSKFTGTMTQLKIEHVKTDNIEYFKPKDWVNNVLHDGLYGKSKGRGQGKSIQKKLPKNEPEVAPAVFRYDNIETITLPSRKIIQDTLAVGTALGAVVRRSLPIFIAAVGTVVAIVYYRNRTKN